MKAYHGSNVKILSVNLDICRKYTDFGKGFYLTTSIEHAKARAESKVKAYGGYPFVSTWEVAEDDASVKGLKIKEFVCENEEWADFVYRSRELGEDNEYDIVIGPIADDNMRYLFRNVRLGQMTITELVLCLKYKQQTKQICFRTERSLDILTLL